jgi:hypothetical protein
MAGASVSSAIRRQSATKSHHSSALGIENRGSEQEGIEEMHTLCHLKDFMLKMSWQ